MARAPFAALALFAALAAPAFAQTGPGDRPPEGASGRERKAAVTAKTWLAVTANRHASEAAAAMLKAGGTAADAAIAAQLVLGLVEPQSSGIGGGGFLMFWEAERKRLFAYDGRETAPAGAGPALFVGADGKPLAFMAAVRSSRSVGVPGAPALLWEIYKRHGRLPWPALFAPAIKLAEEGFAVSPRLHALIAEQAGLKDSPTARAYFFDAEGKPLAVGTVLRNPAYAATLRAMAAEGPKAFYEGAVGKAIVDAVAAPAAPGAGPPGALTAADLAGYRVAEREPLCDTYRVWRICGMGPPSSGTLAVLQILRQLERFEGKTVAGDGAEAAHVFVESSRLAFADRNLYVADPDFAKVPVRGLLLKDYVAARGALIDPARALPTVSAGTPPEGRRILAPDDGEREFGTTHLSIVDAYGNAVSFTTTIENAFGSQIMAAGFLLNNQLTDFSFVAEREGRPVANRVEAGKRPRSSMAPLFVFDREGRLVLVVGSPGGARIISYVARTLIGVLDGGLDVQAAIDRPHVANIGGPAELEKGTAAAALAEALKAKGHAPVVRELTSGLHGIEILPQGLRGGADPRREGAAIGD
jgi:gamma-glutamyltranspeptidase / glutathione hydrolase